MSFFLFGVLFYSSYSYDITGYVAAEYSQGDATAALSNCVQTAGPGRASGPGVPTGGSGARGLTGHINTFNNCLDQGGITASFRCRTDRATGRTTVTGRVGRGSVNVGTYDAQVSEDGRTRTNARCSRGRLTTLDKGAPKNGIKKLYDPRDGRLVARQIALVSINELRNLNQFNSGAGSGSAGSEIYEHCSRHANAWNHGF